MIDIHHRTSGEGLPPGFIDLPPQVYARDPMWIPEDPQSVMWAFGRENPWLADNEAVAFCAPGKSRLAAFFNPSLDIEGGRAAFFGYWETLGDPEADRALFAVAERWARERGATALYGPIDFSTYGNYRLRLSAEPRAVTFPGEPYNPKSYPALLEAQGFAVHQRYLTQVANIDLVRHAMQRRRPQCDEMCSEGYRIEPLTHDLWLANLRELHGLIDEIFGRNFGYTPLSFDSFSRVFGPALIRRSCPESSVIAYAPGGEIAGFMLAYPHYGPLVVQAAGQKRVKTADLDYALHRPALAEQGWRAGISKTVGVSPSRRNQGLMCALVVKMFEWGGRLYDSWFGALIREGNHSARFGAAYPLRERRYALYRKALP